MFVKLLERPWVRLTVLLLFNAWKLVGQPALLLFCLGLLGVPVAVTWKTVAAMWFVLGSARSVASYAKSEPIQLYELPIGGGR